MNISSNISLKSFNTFGINASAKYFTSVQSIENIRELLQSNDYKNNDHLILGGGSNLLIIKNINALVIKNDLKGIEIIILCGADNFLNLTKFGMQTNFIPILRIKYLILG